MAAFIPGASPPLVRTAIRFMVGLLGIRGSPEFRQISPGREDRDPREGSHLLQMPISGDDIVCAGFQGALQEHVIPWIVPNDLYPTGWDHHKGSHRIVKEIQEGLYEVHGHTATAKDCQVFLQDRR
jgi:hypothetical protein